MGADCNIRCTRYGLEECEEGSLDRGCIGVDGGGGVGEGACVEGSAEVGFVGARVAELVLWMLDRVGEMVRESLLGGRIR